MATERIVSPIESGPEEERVGRALRPETLDEYVGQPDLRERLTIAIEAARSRSEPVEHVLLHGPPGLGKTTLAHVIAKEMGSTAHTTSGPALTKGAELVAALTRLGEGDVLFIDEMHRLPIAVEEFVYPAMEDFKVQITVESGLHARTIEIRCKPFTLIGATTRAGLISGPMRSRFGITHHLRYYDDSELETILARSARLLGLSALGAGVLTILASRSRGTPRIANRLLRRVRDFADVRADGELSVRVVEDALRLEGVDELGLDGLDRAYMRAIGEVFKGGPAGLEAIAATMNEDAGTLEDVVEPYLLQMGLLARTRRGRMLTERGARHVGVQPPASIADTQVADDQIADVQGDEALF